MTNQDPLDAAPQSFSELANLDELRYREQIQARSDAPEAFVRKVHASGRLRLLDFLMKRGIVEPCGEILEIGAGSGWLSAQLSLLPSVSRVVATDFSTRLVRDVMPVVAAVLGADRSKLVWQVADFHRLPFEPATFDFVFADSALHHATDVVGVLREARRVLRPSGRLVAVREPVRPLFPWLQVRMRRAVVDELSQYGVAEPLYRRREWDAFFARAGFRLTWQPVSFSTGVRHWAAMTLNGVTRADYCLVGSPRT